MKKSLPKSRASVAEGRVTWHAPIASFEHHIPLQKRKQLRLHLPVKLAGLFRIKGHAGRHHPTVDKFREHHLAVRHPSVGGPAAVVRFVLIRYTI